jgi:predicted O-methyltransferase YrrM
MQRPDIEGWTTDPEAKALAELAAGKTVLEVGAYKGFGTVLMAQAGATVWAVDWHRGDADLGPRDTLCGWWTNVRRHHVEDQVVGLVGRSQDVLPLLREGMFGLAFIDGYHAYEAVTEDVRLALPLLAPGGLVAFHDYSDTWPDVKRAVNELAADQTRGGKVQLYGSLAVVTVNDS